MSAKDLSRAEVLARVKGNEMMVVEASEVLGLSYRQTKRLWARYRKGGAKALVHGSVGRRSGRAKPDAERRRALELVKVHYGGRVGERFGPTLAAEHLAADHGVEVSAETLRRWMLADGQWSRARRRKPHRRRRERKAHFGELVQLDGSFHDWLEGRGPRGCLMNMVDDATGTVLAQMGEQETIWAAAKILRAWIDLYGVPKALYTDWKNVYVRRPTPTEELAGVAPRTHFGCMCAKLGIEIIAASSPQAKGRVERKNGVHQDRLVKKMRLLKIATHEQANAFLAGKYCPEENERFALQASSPTDYHRQWPRTLKPEAVFCLEHERTLSQDWVVPYGPRLLQIKCGQRRPPARARITVRELEDGSIEVWYRGHRLEYEVIPQRPTRAKPATGPALVRKHKPAPTHPWRTMVIGSGAGISASAPTEPALRASPVSAPAKIPAQL